jgi:hypothetical protein
VAVLQVSYNQTFNYFEAGGGTISATPTFAFTFYPLVPWTYSNDPLKTTFGQWGSAEDARRSIKNDVDSAVISTCTDQIDLSDD